MKELKLEKDGLQALSDISQFDLVTTFENGRYVSGIREIYIKLLSMNVGRNNVEPIIESVLEQFTKYKVSRATSFTRNNRELICRSLNNSKNSASSGNCGKQKFNIEL